MHWTSIAASARGAADPDDLDLVLGIALAQPDTSPVAELVGHFHIPLGAVVRSDGRMYRAELVQHPDHAIDVETVEHGRLGKDLLRAAGQLRPPTADRLVTLAMLFGAVLVSRGIGSTPSRPACWNAARRSPPSSRPTECR